MVNTTMTDAQRHAQEEAELKAIETFSTYFPDMFRQWHKKRKLRKMTVDELPWRCQVLQQIGSIYLWLLTYFCVTLVYTLHN